MILPAQELFELEEKYSVARAELEDTILSISNFESCVLEMADVIFDSYDEYFVIENVDDLDWVPTEEQMQRYFALGFKAFWIKYTNFTQRHYWKEETIASSFSSYNELP